MGFSLTNWAYVAGFFDGEGCIHLPHTERARNINLSMSQTWKNRGRETLVAIRDFLAEQGIRSYLYDSKTNSASILAISIQKDVRLFLRECLPWLKVKKTVAQDSLRFWKLFPPYRYTCDHMPARMRGHCPECRSKARRDWANMAKIDARRRKRLEETGEGRAQQA